MEKGSRVRVISGMWTGATGIIKNVSEDGNLVVMLVDDDGVLGQWLMKPHDIELEEETDDQWTHSLI